MYTTRKNRIYYNNIYVGRMCSPTRYLNFVCADDSSTLPSKGDKAHQKEAEEFSCEMAKGVAEYLTQHFSFGVFADSKVPSKDKIIEKLLKEAEITQHNDNTWCVHAEPICEWAFGQTPKEAIEELRDNIKRLKYDLNKLPADELGSAPRKWKHILNGGSL